MKKNLLSILILFCALKTQGQTYTFTFEAATTSPSISSLFVQNLTSGASVLLNGTDTLILETVVGTKELSAETSNNLTVYPNPSAGNFSFEISIQEAAFTNFELIDLNGRKILEKTAWLKSGQYFFTIEGLKSGSYFLKAYNDNYQLVKKIISTAEMTGTPEIKQSFFKESIIENAIGKSDRTSATLSYSTGDVVLVTSTSTSAGGPGAGPYIVYTVIDVGGSSYLIIEFVPCTDASGNEYATVRIGGQLWMAENLRTTHFNDGTSIPLVTDPLAWSLDTNAYCWYDNDSALYANPYGALYKWSTVETGNLCPVGWHVPSNIEWGVLESFVGGGPAYAGRPLKESIGNFWWGGNFEATNATGFTGLPGGRRNLNGSFEFIHAVGIYWTSTETTPNHGWSRWLYNNGPELGSYGIEQDAFSVRCVKD